MLGEIEEEEESVVGGCFGGGRGSSRGLVSRLHFLIIGVLL